MSEKSAVRRSKRDALTPSRCEIPDCQWTYSFQRHRIVPGRDGGKYKLGNVIALCPNHHSLADDGVLSAEYLLEIVQQRIENSAPTENIDQATSARTGDTPEFRHCPAEEPAAGNGECPADAADGIEVGISDS